MNYLDLLPDDVMKIINRKVKDLDIITRKKEKKEKRIYNKYLLLYERYIRNVKLEHCAKMIIDIKEELGLNFFFKAEPVVDVLYPFINIWIIIDHEVYKMKYYDFFTIKNIKMVKLLNYACFYK
jgi:hypothetical protein